MTLSPKSPPLPPHSFISIKSLGAAHAPGEGNEASLFKEMSSNEFGGVFYDRRAWVLGSAVHCAF